MFLTFNIIFSKLTSVSLLMSAPASLRYCLVVCSSCSTIKIRSASKISWHTTLLCTIISTFHSLNENLVLSYKTILWNINSCYTQSHPLEGSKLLPRLSRPGTRPWSPRAAGRPQTRLHTQAKTYRVGLRQENRSPSQSSDLQISVEPKRVKGQTATLLALQQRRKQTVF